MNKLFKFTFLALVLSLFGLGSVSAYYYTDYNNDYQNSYSYSASRNYNSPYYSQLSNYENSNSYSYLGNGEYARKTTYSVTNVQTPRYYDNYYRHYGNRYDGNYYYGSRYPMRPMMWNYQREYHTIDYGPEYYW